MDKTIYIFIGPPFSGKETQTVPLSEELGIPVFSMGALIRKARESDPNIEEAFQKYTAKGLHVPISIKFGLLEKEMKNCPNGFILDNFPASKEDLLAFNEFIRNNNLEVNKVFYLNIGVDELMSRFNNSPHRGRIDDTFDALKTRSIVQAEDRIPVLEYYKNEGKLIEIDGEKPIEEVSQKIHQNI